MPYFNNGMDGHQTSSNMSRGYEYMHSHGEYVPPVAPEPSWKKQSNRGNERPYRNEEHYEAHTSYVAPQATWLEENVYSNNQTDEWNNNPYSRDEWDSQQYEAPTNQIYPNNADEDTAGENSMENQKPDNQEEYSTIHQQSNKYDPDDLIINKKHELIVKSTQNTEFLKRVIKLVMYALRDASDILSIQLDRESKKSNVEADKEGISSSKMSDDNERFVSVSSLPNLVLLGVIRAGAAVQDLLFSDAPHRGETLVLVFKGKPTNQHLTRVAEILKVKLSTQLNDNISVKVQKTMEVIEITTPVTMCPYPIILRFTSPLYGTNPIDEESTSDNHTDSNSELLDKQKCKEALALIRRLRWSSNKIHNDRERLLTRIFMELTTRLPGWKALTPYAAEVLIYAVTEKLSKLVRSNELTIGRIFRQTLEVLSQGIALPNGPGLKDPCEEEPTDVFLYLTMQDAEDLTRSAQEGLRLMACDRLCDLLGLDEQHLLEV